MRIPLVFILLLATRSALAAPVTHFSASDCSVEFDYPAGWITQSIKPEDGEPEDRKVVCSVEIEPSKPRNTEEDDRFLFAIRLTVSRSTFLEAASRAEFDFFEGAWRSRGSDGWHKAEIVRANLWSGVSGLQPQRCLRDGYSGLCDFQTLVVQDKQRHVCTLEGGPQSDEAIKGILATLRAKEK